MTDAGPSSNSSHNRPPAQSDRRRWVTPVLVGGALLVGMGIGAVARGGEGDNTAAPTPAAATVTVSAEPAPTVTISPPPAARVTVTAAAVTPAPVTVTVSASLPDVLTDTVASPDCLRALDLADQGFGFAQKGFEISRNLVTTMTDAARAVAGGNFGALSGASNALSAGTTELNAVTDDINGLMGPYNSARQGCIGR